MQQFRDSFLLGDIVQGLGKDLAQLSSATAFVCCPVIASTRGGLTSLGRFKGNIGLPDIEEFRAALSCLLTDQLEKLFLDFQTATLSKTAVGVLVAFAATMHGRNKKLYLYKVPPPVQAVLQDLAILRFFVCLTSEDELIAAVSV